MIILVRKYNTSFTERIEFKSINSLYKSLINNIDDRIINYRVVNKDEVKIHDMLVFDNLFNITKIYLKDKV
jgi:hypothetical protein